MINTLITILKVIFLLGFLVFIHEGGHFIVAKLCKIKVNEFAIGFGPTIFKKQGKETKYAIRLFPLGGFVNLEGEEERVDSKNSFSNASISKRMAIIVAGGLVNIIFALIVYFILMTSIGNNTSLVVKDTIDGYAAQEYGIQVGDKIIKINNKKINVKSDLDKLISKSNGEEISITIRKENGEIKDINIIPSTIENKATGIYLKNGDIGKIITIDKGSSAEIAGLKANDRIKEIDGYEIKESGDIAKAIRNCQNDKIKFLIQRGKETLEIELEPEIVNSYYLGVVFEKAENNLKNNLYFAMFNTRDFSVSIIDNLKSLFSGKVGLDQMMGPVGISETVAKTTNLTDFIYLMALISMSLGITNLLPFPALDGGKFFLLLIEALRGGKKLKESTEINLQLIGFSILMALAIFVTYNDVLRLL